MYIKPLRLYIKALEIKKDHLIYAAKKGLWPIPVFAVYGAFLVYLRNGELEDFAYGMIPAVFLSICMFIYYLWRTQRNR